MITERLAGLDLERILSGEDVKGAEEINQLGEYPQNISLRVITRLKGQVICKV